MQLKEVLNLLKNVEGRSNQYKTRCPAHDDQTNSLSVTSNNDSIALHCHAGCHKEKILDAMGIKMSDLFLKPLDSKSNSNIEYIYTNEEGKVLHKTIRKPLPDGKKKFFQCRPDGKGGWIWNLKDITPILYNLRALIDAVAKGETIYICEGEKDCENLKAFGLVATTNPMGAGKWKSYYNSYFNGADVVIFPDNDDAGRKHASEVSKNLSNVAKSVKIVKIPDLKEKGDVSDWLQVGGTKEELLKLVDEYKQKIIKKEVKNECEYLDIYEKENCYYSGKGAISNFTLRLEKVVKSDETEAHVLIKMFNGREHRRIISMDSFTSTSKFRRSLSEEQFLFKGNDNSMQDIKILMSQGEYITVKGVESCGIHETHSKEFVFVSDNKTVNSEGTEIEILQQITSKIEIKTNILKSSGITATEIKKISSSMFNFNDLAICGTIWGYISGCLFKPKMKEINRKYGHLFIQGQAGSGKSETVENIITKFFGLISPPLSAGNIKEFALLKACASSNSIPLLIEEYKPRMMSEMTKNIISTIVRSSYDGHIVTRGRADQTIVRYDLQSPLIILGEAGTDETAITERSIELMFSKMNHSTERKINFDILKNNAELLTKLGRSVLDLALLKPVENVQQELKMVASYVDAEIKVDRIRNSIENCIFGLLQLSEVFEREGLTFNEYTGYTFDEIVTAINNNVKASLGDGGRSKCIVDKIIETFDTMAINGWLAENSDYVFINSGAELALDIKRFYDRFLKYCKDFNSGIEYLDRNSFQKQLRTMPYFIDYKKVRFGAENNNAFVLSMHKLTEYKLELQKLLRVFDTEPYKDNVVQVQFKN
ncbi:MAG: hypothetical protein ACD_19C00033G0002 [uncultured bacterium]|nr:MAG: hypothetical protein ACD_19C00033G0002 [uncultured bacterium]